MAIRSISAWQQIQNWRAAQGQANNRELGNLDAVNYALSNAMMNFYSGHATLAGQAALKRVQAAVKAKASATTHGIDQALASLPKAASTTTGTKVNTTA